MTKTKERSLIKFEKTWLGTRTMIINDKVEFFIGTGSSWGIGVEIDQFERCLMFRILNIYMGITVYHNE